MRIGIFRTLCVILFCVCFEMPATSLSYGEPTISGRPPLAREFGSKPGAYDLVIRVSQPIVDPGDNLQVEVYISGYGVIHGARMVSYPSPSVFSFSDSHVNCVGNTSKLGPLGARVDFDDTAFCDVNDARNGQRLSLEGWTRQQKAPIEYDLTINKKVKPGPHSIQFVLTYFDGQTWKTASKNAEFTIRNIYQRYEWWIAIIAFLAAIATIGPMLRWLWRCLLLPLWRRFWPTPAASPATIPVTVGRGMNSKDKKRSRGK